MKPLLFVAFGFLLGLPFKTFSQQKNPWQPTNHAIDELKAAPVALIPYPTDVAWQKKWLVLNKRLTVSFNCDSAKNTFFPDALAPIYSSEAIDVADFNSATVKCSVVSNAGFGKEGYQLVVSSSGIEISASQLAGLYYGLQTLRQLMVANNNAIQVPYCKILDKPAFPIRGFMHDTGRNFQTVASLKRQIKILSQYKFNVFHWHLTDNPAWRIKSKIYPQLADPKFRQAGRDPDSSYTFDQLKEVIAFAKTHHVKVIPELDMPGHSAYFQPTFGFKMETEQGMKMLENLIDEFCEEIPKEDCPIIHLGSDEVHIPNPQEFIKRMTARVEKHGRKTMVWNPGLAAPNETILQLWREDGGTAKMKSGEHPFVDSYGGYLNHMDPSAILRRHFFHQICNEPKATDKSRGGILCCWPDVRVDDKGKIFEHNPVWPTVLTYAESVWCGRLTENPNYLLQLPPLKSTALQFYAEFENRLKEHKDRFFKGMPFPFFASTAGAWTLQSLKLKNEKQVNVGLPVVGNTVWVNKALPIKVGLDSVESIQFEGYIYSKMAKEIEVMIGFETAARSNRQSAGIPENGSWDANGGVILINGKQLEGPSWKAPGANQYLKATWFLPANEIPFTDEEFYWTRKPAKIGLQKGWNKITLNTKKTMTGDNWMFAFIPVSQVNGKFEYDSSVKILPAPSEKVNSQL